MNKVILIFLLIISISSCGEYVNDELSPVVNNNQSINQLEWLIDNQNFDEALPILEETYNKNPEDFYNVFNYINALLSKWSIERKEKEYWEKVIKIAEKALLIFPNESELYRLIWYAYEIMENYDKSLNSYNKSIELDIKNALAYSNRWHAYKLYWEYEKAEEDFLKAYELNKTNDHILINLAWMYSLKWEKYKDKAIELFDNVINTSNNIRFKSEASYSIASLISNKDDYLMTYEDFENAEEYFQKSIDFDPKFEIGYLWLAKIQFLILIKKAQEEKISTEYAEKQIGEILKNNDIAIWLNPTRTISYIQESLILKDLWFNEESEKQLTKALELLPDDITLTKIEKIDLENYINTNK